MVNYPRRKYLFEAYCDDHEAWPELYPEVTGPYFNKIWREEFEDVRLRKHCRFTKCPFCVEQTFPRQCDKKRGGS